MNARRAVSGFTLTEFAVTVAIAAILTTAAVPGFQGLVASQRAKNSSSELFAALFNARSNAIMRNANVAVSPNAGGWANGWQIRDAGNNVLDNHGALSQVGITGGPAAVTYNASGRLAAGSAAPVFLFTAQSGGTTVNQCVSIDLGGRPYVMKGSTC